MPSPVNLPLLEVLLADGSRARDAASLLSTEGSWLQAIFLADAWKVTPQLLSRIRDLRPELPPSASGILRQMFLKAYGSSSIRASQAISAVRCLERAGLPVAAFKGIALMALLYGGPRGRTIHDADLVVLPEHLSNAVRCLEESGFVRRGSETLAEYSEFVGNSPGFAGNRAITLYGEGDCEIDLHWDLSGSGLQTSAILDRVRRATLLNEAIPVVDPADGFLLTVHHAIRENLAIDNVARDLLDIRLWCELLRSEGRMEEAVDRVVESGYQPSVLAVTTLLGEYDPASAAGAMCLRERTSPAGRRSAARLQELFHYQLEHGRLDKDVFYLVHSRPWRQILRGLGTNWSGYWKSMRTVENQLGQDRPLHQRVAVLAKSAPGWRALKLARELARIKYGIRRAG